MKRVKKRTRITYLNPKVYTGQTVVQAMLYGPIVG